MEAVQQLKGEEGSPPTMTTTAERFVSLLARVLLLGTQVVPCGTTNGTDDTGTSTVASVANVQEALRDPVLSDAAKTEVELRYAVEATRAITSALAALRAARQQRHASSAAKNQKNDGVTSSSSSCDGRTDSRSIAADVASRALRRPLPAAAHAIAMRATLGERHEEQCRDPHRETNCFVSPSSSIATAVRRATESAEADSALIVNSRLGPDIPPGVTTATTACARRAHELNHVVSVRAVRLHTMRWLHAHAKSVTQLGFQLAPESAPEDPVRDSAPRPSAVCDYHTGAACLRLPGRFTAKVVATDAAGSLRLVDLRVELQVAVAAHAKPVPVTTSAEDGRFVSTQVDARFRSHGGLAGLLAAKAAVAGMALQLVGAQAAGIGAVRHYSGTTGPDPFVRVVLPSAGGGGDVSVRLDSRRMDIVVLPSTSDPSSSSALRFGTDTQLGGVVDLRAWCAAVLEHARRNGQTSAN